MPAKKQSLKISIPLLQPGGVFLFDKATIWNGEKSGLYTYIEEVPRNTLKSSIDYLKKTHQRSLANERELN